MRRRFLILHLLMFGWWAALAPDSATAVPPAQELIEQADNLVRTDANFPESLKQALALYERAIAIDSQAWIPYVRISRVCLGLGDGLRDHKLSWYEQGAQAAEKALGRKEDSADAHFYFAANRGNAVNLLPIWKVSPGVLSELEDHLLRALVLEPNHARANHMMGMLLYRTPGPLRLLMKGKREQVENYLVRSVEADPNFAEARLDLAQFYKDTGRTDRARAQAQAILTLTDPTPRRSWVEKYRPAAAELLKNLPAQ
jgi:tetratricopeptide (TPR) repeat protein